MKIKLIIVWSIFAVLVIGILFAASKETAKIDPNRIEDVIFLPHELAYRKHDGEIPDEIKKLLERLKVNDQDVEALLELGAYQIAVGDTDLADQNISKASIISNDAKTLTAASILFGRMAKINKAYAALGKALIDEPDNPEIHFRAGVIAFHNMGDTILAVKHWKRFIELKPDASEAADMKHVIEKIMNQK